MTTRSASALLALLGLLLLVPAASATVPAKLRVLTPDRVMDPGTTYIVDEGVTVPTRPDADCFGAPGGSGAEFTYEKPNVLSLLATAGRTTKAVAPLSLTDQFGFGLGICGVGGVQASMGESFWYFKVNHSGGHGRRRPARDQARRRGPLLPRARRLPEPQPRRARAGRPGPRRGRHAVLGLGARARVRDPVESAVRDRVHQRPGLRGHDQRRRQRRRPPARTGARSWRWRRPERRS